MRFDFNPRFAKVFTTKARYIHYWGGRGRGGSHTGTDYFLFHITKPGYFRGCLLRATLSDIRGSLWQDLKDRINAKVDDGQMQITDFVFNETAMSVLYKPTGNTILSKGFRKSSGTQSAKLKSLAGITHILIEEAEEVSEDEFGQLDDSIRTDKIANIQIILLFNPPSKNHWLMKRYYNLVENPKYPGWYDAIPKNIPALLSIHSNYLDNFVNLNQSTINNYRAYGDPLSPLYKPDKFHRDVLGLVSQGKKGRIFTNVNTLTYAQFRALPFPSFYGLDFGFNDPNALTEMKSHNNRLYIHELIYEGGLTNDELVKKMKTKGITRAGKIFADSSEPIAIKTLRQAGFVVIPSLKGPDSINAGIRALQNVELFVTETSTNIIHEFEEYSWALDANKEPTDEPEDANNHAIDGIRYGYMGYVKQKNTLTVPDSRNNKEPWERIMDGDTPPRINPREDFMSDDEIADLLEDEGE